MKSVIDVEVEAPLDLEPDARDDAEHADVARKRAPLQPLGGVLVGRAGRRRRRTLQLVQPPFAVDELDRDEPRAQHRRILE